MGNGDGLNMTDTRLQSMINEASDFLTGNRRNHSGVRLVDELMVDIMGGLIPGVLFNFSLMVCFVLPIVIFKYIASDKYLLIKDAIDNHIIVTGTSSPLFGGWFWFAAFLTFLILSYIAGHIFYRSDINKTDKEDIKRRVLENIDDVKKTIDSSDISSRVNELLYCELKLLYRKDNCFLGLSDIDTETNVEKKELKALLDATNTMISSLSKDSKELLPMSIFVIFPHKNADGKWMFNESSIGKIISQELTVAERIIFCDFYKQACDITKRTIEEGKFEEDEAKLACYLILLLQNETGCSHYDEHRDYPYLNFYKYLLKRNETDLLQHVDWSPASARTKNKINRMKIDIQLDYPDAYAILNKNESHIRMASSSWYVSRFITTMTWWCSGIICVLLLTYWFNTGFEVVKLIKSLSVLLPPCILLILMYNLRHQIEKFIHYQRLREIYFTLYIYHKLEQRKQLSSEIKKSGFKDKLKTFLGITD